MADEEKPDEQQPDEPEPAWKSRPPHPDYPHLRPFVKGISGNPGGRKKGALSLTKVLRKLLEDGDGVEAEKVMRTVLERANSKPDQRDMVWLGSVRMLLDRIDGLVGEREGNAEDEEARTIIHTDSVSPPDEA